MLFCEFENVIPPYNGKILDMILCVVLYIVKDQPQGFLHATSYSITLR